MQKSDTARPVLWSADSQTVKRSHRGDFANEHRYKITETIPQKTTGIGNRFNMDTSAVNRANL
jgi:hypothetical protein